MNDFRSFMAGFQQFRANPTQFMAQNGLDVPQEIAGDPRKIIQHFMNGGRITQAQFNQASEMAKRIQGMMR